MRETLTGLDLLNIFTIAIGLTIGVAIIIVHSINKQPPKHIRRLLSAILATTTVVICFSIILAMAIVLYTNFIK